MSSTSLKECSPPTCHVLVVRGKCPKHRREAWQAQDAQRGTSYERGYDRRWKRIRDAWLAENPLCADPFGVHGDRLAAASEVDHIEPHRGDIEKFWRAKNLQSLCKPCHSRKTMEENRSGRS
jgi:5-methylcytosine-specific restriction protein A